MSKTNIARGSLTFGATTLLSRLLGMLRDVVVASAFGAGVAADAFYVAFRFANLFRAFFAEGAFAQAFIPNLARVVERDPTHERLFVGNMLLLLGSGLLMLVLTLELAADWVISWYAYGYRDNAPQLQLVTDLLQITIPYAWLISLAALLNAVLQNHQRFFVSGFAPVMLNLCLIVAALWAGQFLTVPIYALAWATLVAGVIQLFMPLLQLAMLRKLPALYLRHWHPEVTKTLLMFVPVVLSASVTQIALLIDTLLATFLQTGSVTWLYIANRLIGFPLGIFGISVAVAILPVLARARAAGDAQRTRRIFAWAVHCICLIAIPASAALMLVPEQIVVTLFYYGAFTFTDVLQTAAALRTYALGLTGMMLMKILLNQFLAVGDAKTPLGISLATTLMGVMMSLVLMQWLEHRGIALATALASLVNAGLMYLYAYRRGLVVWYSGFWRAGGRIVLASVAMVGLCLLVFAGADEWAQYNLGERITRLGGGIALALVTYAIAMLALGWRPGQLRSP